MDNTEHTYELKKTPEGYTVAQCTRCGYWLWETFHGVPPCVPTHNEEE